MQNSENVFTRTVLIERMLKMSYLLKKDQKLYMNIDIFAEYRSLVLGYNKDTYKPLLGYYVDSDFLNNILE